MNPQELSSLDVLIELFKFVVWAALGLFVVSGVYDLLKYSPRRQYRPVTSTVGELNVVLDLETFGVDPGSQIRSIGAVVFSTATGAIVDSFYCAIDSRSQEKVGLTQDQATLEWWTKQSDAAKAAFTNPMPLDSALWAFSSWYTQYRVHNVWALGSYFDFSLLSAAYRAVTATYPDTKLKYPIDHRKQCCLRSINAICPFEWGDSPTAHHALVDAERQAAVLYKALKRLRVVNA